MSEYEVIVVGGGPSGAVVSTYLAQAGVKVCLLEKENFPRYQIGESLLPASKNIFTDIGVWEKIEDAGFVKKRGALFHSEVTKKSAYFDFETTIHDSFPYAHQVDRKKFDLLLLNNASENGVIVKQNYEVKHNGKRENWHVINDELKSKYLIWANGLTHRRLYPDRYLPNKEEDRMTGVFTYFKANFSELKHPGTILINIFRVGNHKSPVWSWMIPLSDQEASVGFVLPSHLVQSEFEKYSIEELGHELLKRNPELERYIDRETQFKKFELRHNFQRISRSLSYDREYLIGDAAGFIDPVFSSGIHLGMLSGKMLASELIRVREGKQEESIVAVNYEKSYRVYFDLYYRFVKLFYQRNIVESLFLGPDNFDSEALVQKLREMTSILSGDVRQPNELINIIRNSKITIDPDVLQYLS